MKQFAQSQMRNEEYVQMAKKNFAVKADYVPPDDMTKKQMAKVAAAAQHQAHEEDRQTR